MARTTPIEFDEKDAAYMKKRLFRSTKTNEESGCIEWVDALNESGYGMVWYKTKMIRAHRASYAAHKGAIAHGLYVCHKCDNPKCINPDHLFLGSNADNCADMARKKRSTIGEKNPRAKLTVAKVQAIKIWLQTGLQHRIIASKFGVAASAIGLISRGERWKGV